jgi:hypothetical protein
MKIAISSCATALDDGSMTVVARIEAAFLDAPTTPGATGEIVPGVSTVEPPSECKRIARHDEMQSVAAKPMRASANRKYR